MRVGYVPNPQSLKTLITVLVFGARVRGGILLSRSYTRYFFIFFLLVLDKWIERWNFVVICARQSIIFNGNNESEKKFPVLDRRTSTGGARARVDTWHPRDKKKKIIKPHEILYSRCPRTQQGPKTQFVDTVDNIRFFFLKNISFFCFCVVIGRKKKYI